MTRNSTASSNFSPGRLIVAVQPIFYRVEPADRGTKCFWISDSVRQLGYEPTDFVSGRLSFMDVVCSDDAADEFAGYRHVLAELRDGRRRQDYFTTEYRARDASGVLHPVRDQMSAQWHEGDIAEISGMLSFIAASPGYVPLNSRRTLEPAQSSSRIALGMATHDLQTPMTLVDWGVNQIGGRIAGDEEAMWWLRLVQRASQEMRETIEKTLEWVRVDQIQMSQDRIKIADVMEAAIDRTFGVAGLRSVAPIVRPADGAVLGDVDCLRRLFENVFSNVIRYGKAPFSIAIQNNDPWVQIEIRDHGVGFPAGVVARFGETLISGAEGHGLGLSIIKLIAERHGGSFAISNDSFGGAKYHVALRGA